MIRAIKTIRLTYNFYSQPGLTPQNLKQLPFAVYWQVHMELP